MTTNCDRGAGSSEVATLAGLGQDAGRLNLDLLKKPSQRPRTVLVEPRPMARPSGFRLPGGQFRPTFD